MNVAACVCSDTPRAPSREAGHVACRAQSPIVVLGAKILSPYPRLLSYSTVGFHLSLKRFIEQP